MSKSSRLSSTRSQRTDLGAHGEAAPQPHVDAAAHHQGQAGLLVLLQPRPGRNLQVQEVAVPVRVAALRNIVVCVAVARRGHGGGQPPPVERKQRAGEHAAELVRHAPDAAAGGEVRKQALPGHRELHRELRQQCRGATVAFRVQAQTAQRRGVAHARRRVVLGDPEAAERDAVVPVAVRLAAEVGQLHVYPDVPREPQAGAAAAREERPFAERAADEAVDAPAGVGNVLLRRRRRRAGKSAAQTANTRYRVRITVITFPPRVPCPGCRPPAPACRPLHGAPDDLAGLQQPPRMTPAQDTTPRAAHPACLNGKSDARAPAAAVSRSKYTPGAPRQPYRRRKA